MVKNTDSTPNAVLDTNVLYPIILRDFACWLQWHGAHRMVWSNELGIELCRALSRSGSDPAIGARVWRQLNQAFPTNLKEFDPGHLKGLPDPNDEHIAQLAFQHQSQLVTFNLRDFPADLIKPLVVRHPDEYFLRLVKNYPVQSFESLHSMKLARHKMPVTTAELLESLALNRLPATAEFLSRLDS
jgi:predicted nucleic acid-binding protein